MSHVDPGIPQTTGPTLYGGAPGPDHQYEVPAYLGGGTITVGSLLLERPQDADAQDSGFAGRSSAQRHRPASTDAVSVLALITGLVGLNLLALILGVGGIARTGPDRRRGRAAAVIGLVLGALELVAIAAWFIVSVL